MLLKISIYIFFLLFQTFVSANSSYVLMISLYNETNVTRFNEFITCFEINVSNPLITEYFVYYDTSKDTKDLSPMLQFLGQKKVKIVYIDDRPTFTDFFNSANYYYPNRRIIVSNADIFFNQTLSLLNNVNLENKFLALTRWDVTKDGSLELFHYRADTDRIPAVDSQDAWIFTTPITFNNKTQKIGTMGCDNRLAYQVARSGYQVLNPCLSIQCCHLHLSGIRNYDPNPISPEPYLPVYWCTIDNLLK